jgi:hypothetical protein
VAPPRRAESSLEFTSSDEILNKGFAWAKRQALSYVFRGDSVGDRYEAALPGRQAFCMRDVSHQASGARCLGLAAVTLNMLGAFARSVAESRDWCAFWEIDRTGAPCPADYRDDAHFWYNLPAGFDVLRACLSEHLWTGERAYIDHPDFLRFYTVSMADFIERWDRDGDGIPEHRPGDDVRGLGSYNEGTRGRQAKMGADLVALLYAAWLAYATLVEWAGDRARARACRTRAATLKSWFNGLWWDAGRNRLHSLMLDDGSFADEQTAEARIFPLLCGILEDGPRTATVLDQTLAGPRPDVEARSYLPETWFLHGRVSEAVDELRALVDPRLPRREYPEVSFAVVGSLVTGLLGIGGDSRRRVLSTQPRLPRDMAWASTDGLPVMGNLVRVRHEAGRRSTCESLAGPELSWHAHFAGRVEAIVVDGRRRVAHHTTGPDGRISSWTGVTVTPGSRHVAELP